ncbi:MAG: lysophospholipid acyltransferase family protein [Catalinimonas sp.]
MIVLLPFMTLPFLFGDRRGGRTAYRFLALWSYLFSWLVGVRYRTQGREHVRAADAYIYTSSHNSYMDIPTIMREVPGQFRPLAKSEMARTPIFGWIYRYATVMVNRHSPESRRASLNRMKEVLRKGISIFIFPEGRINLTDAPLTPFYDGAFRVAIETQRPVAPLVILNSRNIMPRERADFHPGVITTVFARPIPTEGLTLADVPALKQRVYQVMEEMMTTHAPAVAES